MPNLLNNTSFNKTTFNTIAVILLIFFYYKLYLEFFIPITGDELNSILIYSSNIKTLFLKNYPGNVTFFHFLGYLKTSIFGYDLNIGRIDLSTGNLGYISVADGAINPSDEFGDDIFISHMDFKPEGVYVSNTPEANQNTIYARVLDKDGIPRIQRKDIVWFPILKIRIHVVSQFFR